MDTNQKLITMDMKAKLSTLWIFVLFPEPESMPSFHRSHANLPNETS